MTPRSAIKTGALGLPRWLFPRGWLGIGLLVGGGEKPLHCQFYYLHLLSLPQPKSSHMFALHIVFPILLGQGNMQVALWRRSCLGLNTSSRFSKLPLKANSTINQENSYLSFSFVKFQSKLELKLSSLPFETMQGSCLYSDTLMIFYYQKIKRGKKKKLTWKWETSSFFQWQYFFTILLYDPRDHTKFQYLIILISGSVCWS